MTIFKIVNNLDKSPRLSIYVLIGKDGLNSSNK